jgi:hypothetical protein
MQITYTTFLSSDEAEDCRITLRKAGIASEIEEGNSLHDEAAVSVQTGGVSTKHYALKIDDSDLDVVNAALREAAEAWVDSLPEDYYLYDFTDEELFHILKCPDLWSSNDYVLAQHILAKHGKSVSEVALKQLREERVAQLTQPISSSLLVNILCLALPCIFIIGGGLTMLRGWYLMNNSNSTALTGEYLIFDEESRKWGKRLFWWGIIGTLVTALYMQFFAQQNV